MALKKKAAKKGKPTKTAKVKKAPKVKASKVTKTKAGKAKPSVGSKVKTSLLGITDRAIETYTGSSVSGVVKEFKGTKGTGKKRRRGTVPKTVRKWIGKITRRRKNEEKQIKKLVGSDGGKVIRRPKKSYGFSPGVITRSEAMEAMRR